MNWWIESQVIYLPISGTLKQRIVRQKVRECLSLNVCSYFVGNMRRGSLAQ